MTSRFRTCPSTYGLPPLFALLVCSLACGSLAQPENDDHCTAPLTHAAYVNSLRRHLPDRDEEARRIAIDKLLCIARRDVKGFSYGGRAVTVLFSLAPSPVEARALMQALALEPNVSSTVCQESCRLLTLVSDPTAVTAVRESLFASWPGGHSIRFVEFLTEAADGEFLVWLDRQIEATESGTPFRAFLEQAAKRVRVQERPDELLRSIRDESCASECSWFVLQAYRHGVEDVEIRHVILEVLARGVSDRDKSIVRRRLLCECYDFGILSTDEVRAFPELSRIARIGEEPDEEDTPGWVEERVSSRQAAFYHLPRAAEHDGKKAGN